jgi:hypothetical protein
VISAMQSLQRAKAVIYDGITKMKYDLGLTLLDNPKAMDQTSRIHQAIYAMRWTPDQLVQMHPSDIIAMGVVLSAHQVYVQGLENEWSAKYQLLSKESRKVVLSRRDSQKGKTKAEQEAALFLADPEVREMHHEYLIARAMARLLRGMGERFKQLEDGIKRPADLRSWELQRTRN